MGRSPRLLYLPDRFHGRKAAALFHRNILHAGESSGSGVPLCVCKLNRQNVFHTDVISGNESDSAVMLSGKVVAGRFACSRKRLRNGRPALKAGRMGPASFWPSW